MIDMLEVLGISADDERIYRSLLRQPGISAVELGRAVGRLPDSVRLAVDRLESVGLVTRVDCSDGLQATRPDVAVDVLVARKQAELAAVQTQARSLLEELPRDHVSEPQDYLEIIRGREAVAHRFLQLEQTTQVELLVLDRPPYAQEVTEPNQGELDLLARGVRCRGIYAPEAIEQPASLRVLQQSVAAGEEARVHPNLPLKLAISDRSAALLPLTGEESTESALVIRASMLLEALVALFELLWASAVPLPDEPHPDHDVELVALLAAGLKDETIARQLGISGRSLSRRTNKLMAELGARTRFQGGIQATRLGLLRGEPG
jgi:sugar-specific transcriptional regulator TrmB